MRDYLLGLATLPGIALAVCLVGIAVLPSGDLSKDCWKCGWVDRTVHENSHWPWWVAPIRWRCHKLSKRHKASAHRTTPLSGG